NCAGGGRNAPSSNGGDVSQASIADAAGTLWVGDMEAHNTLDYPYRFLGNTLAIVNGDGGKRLQTGIGSSAALVARHLEMTNVLFTDGHVKSLRLESIMAQNPTPATAANKYPMLTPESD
ncbi:hypothetical protein EON80_19930, partial [bacterium]